MPQNLLSVCGTLSVETESNKQTINQKPYTLNPEPGHSGDRLKKQNVGVLRRISFWDSSSGV